MKQLMLTTAIVMTAGFSAAAQGTTEDVTNETAAADETEMMVPGFRVSDFTGKTLYAFDPESIENLQSERMGDADTRSARWTDTDSVIAERDQWENIGQIDDVILTADGTVQGVLLDVGGFLGIGAHTVLVDMDDLYLVLKDGDKADNAEESDDIGDLSVIASLSRDQLEALPEWDEDNLRTGYPLRDSRSVAESDLQTGDAAVSDDDAAATDAVAIDSTTATTPTADELTGAEVKDPAGDKVGKVEDLVLEGDQVSGVVIDVGGFLGIGAHRVMIPVESLAVVRDDDGESVKHVETGLTKDELEAMPEYED